MNSMFANDELQATIDPHVMKQIKETTIELYTEMKTVPDKKRKGQMTTLEESEIKKIRQMDVLQMLGEVEVSVNEKIAGLNILMHFNPGTQQK